MNPPDTDYEVPAGKLEGHAFTGSTFPASKGRAEDGGVNPPWGYL